MSRVRYEINHYSIGNYMKYFLGALLLSGVLFLGAQDTQGNTPEKTALNKTPIRQETVVITVTQQETSLFDTSLSVGRIEDEEIATVRLAHPSDLVNRVAGVNVNNLGGESHFTAIRNNLSTGANYLFLENGVPTRSTGFFNHNALYEINMPQASAVEVVKGPGSALYGSDAMHGMINVLSGAIPDEQLIKLGAEFSDQNWYRHLLTYGDRLNPENAFRLDLNQTFNDGWRDNSEHTRDAFTGQWLWTPAADFKAKTVFSYNYVDQSLQSGLSRDDYKNNPEENYYHLPGRDVESFRVSSKMTKTLDSKSEINITPYYRKSTTSGLIPSWKLNHKPNSPFRNYDISEIHDSNHSSFGVLTNYVQNFKNMDSKLIIGLDLDYSPGETQVEETNLTREFRANGTYFTDYYRTGTKLYDYDPTYKSISPYVHYEFRPLDKWKFDLGLRYDYSEFEIDQNIKPDSGSSYAQVRDPIADQTVEFDQFSPKFGFNWDFHLDHQLYGSYRRGFRAPSAGTLFSQPASYNSTQLESTTIDSFELGLRGFITDRISYDLSAYHMFKKDDIISYRDPNNPNEVTSAQNGETEHRGIELALQWQAHDDWTLAFSGTYTEHTYEKWDLGAAPSWAPNGPSGTDLEGNELERAPKYLHNLRVNYHPEWMKGGRFEVETIFLGSYFVDQENSHKYSGHELVNFRVDYPINKKLTAYSRVMNVFDRENAAYVSSSDFTPYRPGEPRSFFFGLEYTF